MPWSILAVCYGGLDDLSVAFEVRAPDGILAGWGDTFYGWDGEQPCEWGRDPWDAAAEAVGRALTSGKIQAQHAMETAGTLWEGRA